MMFRIPLPQPRKKNQISSTLLPMQHLADFSQPWTSRQEPALSWTPPYTVLSRLSHAHPWTSLILDLKDLMPDLDRHYHHQLAVSLFQPHLPQLTPYIIVDQFLYSLALTITNILNPPNSQVDPPEIDSYFFHPNFWHRHLIHGTNLASPSFFDASLVDTLAGNQLCQWSTVGAAEGRGPNQKDTLLLASHLIIHLPPRVGAYVLASHPDLARITSDTTGNEANSRFHAVPGSPKRTISLATTPPSTAGGCCDGSRTGHSGSYPRLPHSCPCLSEHGHH